ncbi:MAG: tryptophan synthase subunit alpha [Chloroflexi bacterium]|nr:tryptophan synthase subunit alpha [Chloroflexota bacterium]
MAEKRAGLDIRGLRAIEEAFRGAQGEGRAALITYLTVGYPTPGDTIGLVRALQEGGADLIELGVPFSDPVADGPTIQRASYAALRQGVTPKSCLEIVHNLRHDGIYVPILLMGYYNPILSYGPRQYALDCRACGVDGLIVPDLPPEEADELATACREQGLALVFLVAPTSSEKRIALLSAATSGFLYVVRRLGITGADQASTDGLEEQLAAVRRHARTPIALGFGLSSPDQIAAAAKMADGVIVGSAVVDRANNGAQTLREYVASLRIASRRHSAA